jgi:RNA polymerase sigma factor (sigma-70 family)
MEQELIRGCAKNDRTSQKKLFDTYAGKFMAIAKRYMKEDMLAEDVLMEGFYKIYSNIKSFKGDGSFEGWMRRIFVNTAIEHYRKKNQLYAISENQEENISNQELSALDALEADDIIRLISELPNGYRTVFNLFAVEGYSHKEIATMMNISEGTSKSQYARAKAWLQEKIGNRNQEKS